MRTLGTLFTATIVGIAMTIAAGTADAEPKPEDVLIMELESGSVTIEMLPELAPNHVARIRELTRQGFYDGIVFPRVIDGFMAQTGDPTGTGSGGSGQNIAAEFTPEDFGVGRATLDQLLGGDADTNAEITKRILGGEAGPTRGSVDQRCPGDRSGRIGIRFRGSRGRRFRCGRLRSGG